MKKFSNITGQKVAEEPKIEVKITEADIWQSVSDNNLESYQPEVFSQAVWVCK